MPTAVEFLLKIDGITDPKSTGIPFESYSFGVVDAAANIGSQSAGAGAGKVTFNPFSITRKIDKASPLLFQAAVKGQHIQSATITLLPAVQKAMPIVYTLTNVLITEVNEAGNVHGGVPLQEIRFEFEKIQIAVEEVSVEYSLTTAAVT